MRGDPSDILGPWMSAGWKVRLDAVRDGDAVSMVLAEGMENGERDQANPDPSLRTRPLLGARLVDGLRWNGGSWTGGRIYDPQSGTWYGCTARSAEKGALIVRGYIGLPFIGISQRFERPGTRRDFGLDALNGYAGPGMPQPWSAERTRAWMAERPWPLGCNYVPASASNELEMWQEDTFSPATITREMELAAGLGFTCLRVFLHFLPWQAGAAAFTDRIRRFLDMISRRGLSAVFVLFDDCWNDNPRPGRQRKPVPGVHNSRWLRCPGSKIIRNAAAWSGLEGYVKGLMDSFRGDGRILAWDLYNEIGNGPGFLPETTRLLARVFRWAREADPGQPLTCGIWKRSSWFAGINDFMIANSDIVSFHNYGPLENLAAEIDQLQVHGKPLLCTEYMARSQGSLFSTHLPLLRRSGVGAFNWGFVDGRTQTKYPWGSRRGAPEPEPWFHEIFRADGTPYDRNEVACIRAQAAFSKK